MSFTMVVLGFELYQIDLIGREFFMKKKIKISSFSIQVRDLPKEIPIKSNIPVCVTSLSMYSLQ